MLGLSGPLAVYMLSKLGEGLANPVPRDWQSPSDCGGRAGRESAIASKQAGQGSRGWTERQLCWVPLGKVLPPQTMGVSNVQ